MNTGNRGRTLRVQVMVWLLLALAVPRLAEAGSNGSQKVVGPEAQQKLAKVQIPFIPNRGQSSKEVKFTARTFAGTVSVTETGGLVYSLPKLEGEKPVQGVALKEELMGGKVKEVVGESQAVTKVSYFRGNDRSKWQSNLPSYDRVSLGEVYEGIDVKLKAYGNNVEKLFYVKPGAEPESIKIKLSGGKELRVNDSGELEVETEQGTVRFSKPVAFQEDGGKKEFVEAAYAVWGNRYGFKVANYDQTRELVIDPILEATFVGGGNADAVRALALDGVGGVYVAGDTSSSSDFPGISAGSAYSTLSGGGEIFIVKLNSDLRTILAATFLGGNSHEVPSALAIDNNGSVYVAGETTSADFPGVGPGSADSTFAGFGESFIAKLNPDLSSILAATFLGGGTGGWDGSAAGRDNVSALVLDSVGNVYVAGFTLSSNFPGIGPGSSDSTGGGFVAKLNSNLSSIQAATLLLHRFPAAMSLDGTGNVYVAGQSGFVTKLDLDLTSILAETFLGGRTYDYINALVVDATGNVYVGGRTRSSGFPGPGPGSADSTARADEGFVTKLSQDLSAILAATFLGGSDDDSVRSLALDGNGNLYVVGISTSSDFPGVGPGSADSFLSGIAGEGFASKLNSDLSSILAATFLGGIHDEVANAIAVDGRGNVYVAGETHSSDFPGVGPGSADSILGSIEGFVAKLDANLSSGQEIINDKVNFVVQNTSFNPTPVTGGQGGSFMVTAVLTNKGTEIIREPIHAVVRTLTNGNKLVSATEGFGGAGSKQAIDAGYDDILSPNESATVRFRIGLVKNASWFDFFVDVWGTLSPQ